MWLIFHALVLHTFHFDWLDSALDSGISNLLLAGFILVVSLSLQFYIPQKNLYGYLVSLSVILSAFWLLLSRTILLLVIDRSGRYNEFFSDSLLIRGAIGFLLLGCMALISVLWYTQQEQQEMNKRKAEVDRLAREAELNSLRQQLQPHFLFNSLNSINALIGAKPDKARVMIQQLSDFLRGTLKKDDRNWITVDEELKHLQLYLDIEKVRFGHRLSAEIVNEADSARLPSMLLQPVVENAIKFGLYDTTAEITIEIKAVLQNNQLQLIVLNPFDPETRLSKAGTGFGLSSVQRRLNLLFGRSDLLRTDTAGDQFITTITIPQP
jgi:two-component system, LytTR family, sensor kinase